MATSGIMTFLMTRDEIIAAALRTMEVIGAGESASPEDLLNCGQALNIICKALVTKGLPLWCVQDISIPLIAATSTYAVGPVSATPRPLRILQAYLRKPDGNDVPVEVVSHMDYLKLGSKAQASQPNQLYYDATLLNGSVTLYGIPPDATNVLHLLIQRQIQDFNLGTDNPDFPQEAYQMLKWLLVDELSLEYGAKMHVIQVAAGKAKVYTDEFMGSNVEEVSHYFVPSGRTC